MAREKKETVEENKKIGAWANGLRIVCNILKVFTIIGIVCLTLVLFFMPRLLKGIKIDDEKIVLFDQKIEYSFKEVDFLTYRIDNGKEKTINTRDIYKYINLAEIGKTDMNKVRNVIMINLAFVIVICVLEFMILNLFSGLLKRTKNEGVAFVEDGHKVIVNAMWITLGIQIVRIVIGLCNSVALADLNADYTTNIDIGIILSLCIMYFISLLYKRGEELQG